MHQLALVIARLALLAMVIGHTIAHRRSLLHQAQRSIAARRIRALLHFLFAVRARKARRTSARILGQSIDANGSILTRRRRTLVNVPFAVDALPAGSACARVLKAMPFDALAAVQAANSISCWWLWLDFCVRARQKSK